MRRTRKGLHCESFQAFVLADSHQERILPLPDEVIEAWRLELNQHDGLPKFTNVELVVLFA